MNNVLVLRRSEWNGADNELIRALTTESPPASCNALLVGGVGGQKGFGTRCCLGVDMSQRHGVDDSHLLGVQLPSDLKKRDVGMPELADYMTDYVPNEFWDKIGSEPQTLRKFESIAAEINDSLELAVEEKVQMLSHLYGTIGVTVEYRENE